MSAGLPGFSEISQDDQGWIHIGAGVTHNQVVSSSLLSEKALPLVLAAWNVGSPQIRNRGTIAGNLITASPANDTITPLIALGAKVKCKCIHGEREILLNDFYTGVRKTVMQPDEMVVDISFPALKFESKGDFHQICLQKSPGNLQSSTWRGPHISMDKIITACSITLGAVAPTIIHAAEAEKFLVGKNIDHRNRNLISRAIASEAAKPIDDIRSSARYRQKIVGVMLKELYSQSAMGKKENSLPQNPVLLWGKKTKSGRIVDVMHIFMDHTKFLTPSMERADDLKGGSWNHNLLRLLRE